MATLRRRRTRQLPLVGGTMDVVKPLPRSIPAILSAALMVLAVFAWPASGQTAIRGFAELHSHQFANLACGGWAVPGSPDGPAAEELSEEKDSHHSWRHHFDVMGGLLAGYAGPIDYGNDGAPTYGGWPSFFEVSHQK